MRDDWQETDERRGALAEFRHRRLASLYWSVRCNLAALRVSLALRRLIAILRREERYDSNQPRVPAGHREGGQWTSGTGGGTPSAGQDPAEGPDTPEPQDPASADATVVSDTTGTAPFDYFVNVYAADGALASQDLFNRDGSAIATQWGAIDQPWLMRQTIHDAQGQVFTDTTLSRDGSADMQIGPAADGRLALLATGSGLTIAEAGTAGAQTLPATVESVALLNNGGAFVTTAETAAENAAGAGLAFPATAFVAGMTAFSTPAGDIQKFALAPGLRIAIPGPDMTGVIEQYQSTNLLNKEIWTPIEGVDVRRTADGLVAVDAGALHDAIGSEKFATIRTAPGDGINLSFEPVPLAARDIPGSSIFATPDRSGTVYAVPGTSVDWSKFPDSAQQGEPTVLELHDGLTWRPGQSAIIGALTTKETETTCPAWPQVVATSVATDSFVRSLPGSERLSPRDLGTQIHQTIAAQVKQWGEGFHAELGVDLAGTAYEGPGVLPQCSSRLDILERTKENAVCIYDIKTGDGSMLPQQMSKYYAAALRWATTEKFSPAAIFVIPVYTKF